jgi:hypothetical protein
MIELRRILFKAILILMLLNLASAAELKMTGELRAGEVIASLQNFADYEVSFTLKFQLRQKLSSWKLLEELCEANGSLGPLESGEYPCSFEMPGESGEYKIYVRADIVNSTFTYRDFLFSVGDKGFKEPEPSQDVVLRFLSAPDKVKTGEEFNVSVNVTAYKDVRISVYSYVYEGKTCKSFWGWTGNSQKHDLKRGESKVINLTDAVSHDTVNGSYRLKVRARGDKDWDIIRSIEVEQVEPDLFRDISTQDRQETEDLSIPGLLPLLAAIPLILLVVKKML